MFKRVKFVAAYWVIRFFSGLVSILPYPLVNGLGRILGSVGFHFFINYRKRILSNLALATTLKIHEKQIHCLAKKSMQNLAITLLEFCKLAKEKDLSRIVHTENPEVAEQYFQQGKGIIFFCGHQANWELLFLDGIWRFGNGLAIAREIKNPLLYRWIKSVREKFGGKIVSQKQALKEGLRALKAGEFIGIVGDQGMPESPFSSLFLGRKAWTSSAPALLAYKTGSPIIVATITRKKNQKYVIHYSKPLLPDCSCKIADECERLMHAALAIFEQSVIDHPEQWLWLHNRWKQETPNSVYYRFRQDSILIIIPKEHNPNRSWLQLISLFRSIYPKAFLSVAIPYDLLNHLDDSSIEVIPYQKENGLFMKDYRFKLIFNFTENRSLKKHFLKQSAFEVLTLNDLKQIALDHKHILLHKHYSPHELIKRALCRPNTFWQLQDLIKERTNDA